MLENPLSIIEDGHVEDMRLIVSRPIVRVRICKKCEVSKALEAFIRTRAICRLCWIYLSEEEKRSNLSYVGYAQKTMEKKTFSKFPHL